METNRQLALMIDGDNAQASLLPEMLAEVSKYGILIIRRVYGDWTEPNMKSWKEVLHNYALQPIQQFRYTTGKNATDSALIIDTMDLLYTAGVNGFCIASSDSDYTRLATRIREKNLFVMGIGRNLTPRSFVNACDVFVYTENLQAITTTDNADKTEAVPTLNVKPTAKASPDAKTQPVGNDKTQTAALEKLFRTAFELAVQEDGWATLSVMGTFLRQLDPGFDPRTYGHTQLTPLVQAHPEFIDIREVKSGSGRLQTQIRLKGKRKTAKKPATPS